MHHVTIKSRVINSIAIVLRILKKTKTKIKKCVGGKLLTKSFQETSIGVNQTQKTLYSMSTSSKYVYLSHRKENQCTSHMYCTLVKRHHFDTLSILVTEPANLQASLPVCYVYTL